MDTCGIRSRASRILVRHRHRHFGVCRLLWSGVRLQFSVLGSPGLCSEVHHANQKRTPRIRLLSRSVANVDAAFRLRLMSNVAIASWAAARSYWRNSVGMIRARVGLGGDFKRCCMLSGEFDGSDRDYFF